jgi:diaminopimelate epimerase
MLSFVKLTAAGNDFVLIDGRDGLPEPPEALARRLCTRRLSIGADGLLIVEVTGGLPELAVTHFEPDGSRTFCLNGARGAAAWLVATGQLPAGDGVVLRTDLGDLDMVPDEFEVEVTLPPARCVERRSVLLDDGVTVLGCYVDVGNPQFVVVLDSLVELESHTLMDRARAIRWQAEVFPDGTNVCFVAQDHDVWQLRTFERGVEDETLSCGTGAVAAACALIEAPYPEAVLASASHGRPHGSGAPTAEPLTLILRTRVGDAQRITFPQGPGSARILSRGPVHMVAGGQLWS